MGAEEPTTEKLTDDNAAHCDDCGWVGLRADLLLGYDLDEHCPKCDSKGTWWGLPPDDWVWAEPEDEE
jgi:hypothetical protein